MLRLLLLGFPICSDHHRAEFLMIVDMMLTCFFPKELEMLDLRCLHSWAAWLQLKGYLITEQLKLGSFAVWEPCHWTRIVWGIHEDIPLRAVKHGAKIWKRRSSQPSRDVFQVWSCRALATVLLYDDGFDLYCGCKWWILVDSSCTLLQRAIVFHKVLGSWQTGGRSGLAGTNLFEKIVAPRARPGNI